MSQTKKQCPECRIQLKLVRFADLIEESKVQNIDVLSVAANFISDHLDFYVCTACGFTRVYAGRELRRVAAEKSAAIIGNS